MSACSDKKLEDAEIELDALKKADSGGDKGVGVGAIFQLPAVPVDLAKILSQLPRGGRGSARTEKKTMKVNDARQFIEESETERELGQVDFVKEAITAVEQSGIVFIDEIDKIVKSSDSYRSADASDEGVQRDLLPIIEGSVVSTKHGNVNTEFILFICSGAFHSNKPSDLLPELQGRLPIKVQLKGLNEEDLHRILTEPVSNLIRQQVHNAQGALI
jgi:ATP-dependent HslUV protease ATP-binding subunit HslU